MSSNQIETLARRISITVKLPPSMQLAEIARLLRHDCAIMVLDYTPSPLRTTSLR
jgi:hypothetical protein